MANPAPEPERVDFRILRNDKFRNPQRIWKKTRQDFRPFEEQGLIKYNRVLGFGGFGIATLWDTNRGEKVAIKTINKEDSGLRSRAMKREIWWTKRFTGSEHLIQLLNLDDRITNQIDINNEYSRGNQPRMAMENMDRGNLHILMRRVAHMKKLNQNFPPGVRGMEYIPTRTLWSMFLCLTRACIGIAYPPGDAPEDNQGHAMRESCNGVTTPPSRNVHCDIDPSNIFIGAGVANNREREHRWHPILKIADYGCMVEWDDDWSMKEKDNSLWGKPGYKAPEQFKPVCYHDESMGSHTNVYQIGQTMHDLLTLSTIPYKARKPDRRILEDDDGQVYMDFITFGWRLLRSDEGYEVPAEWNKIDVELRDLIAGCMALEPDHRPTLPQLEETIVGRIKRLEEESLLWQITHARPDNEAPMEDSYRYRYPERQPEPASLLDKFYKEYFLDDWRDPDRYANYWSKSTMSSFEDVPKPAQPLSFEDVPRPAQPSSFEEVQRPAQQSTSGQGFRPPGQGGAPLFETNPWSMV